MPLSIQEHSNLLTQKVVGKFEEMTPVRTGFAGWFPEETSSSLLVSVEVQRDSDLIAVDVVRFTEGNKNKSSRLTEHLYQPPYFKEDYDFQRDQVYMNTIGNGVGLENPRVNRQIAENAVKGVSKNRDKVLRAIRKQQADVLQTGIVTLKNGDNIDFRRKAASMVNVSTGGGVYWGTSATATPITDIRKGLDFLRNVGNSGGSAVNVVMRSKALEALLATTQIKEQGPNTIQQIQRININMPQFDGVSGFAFHGQIAAGDFNVNLWTYNEKYTDENGATQYYLDEKYVVMMPDDFQGKTVFGALPTLNQTSIGGVTADVPGIVEAQYLIRSYSDKKTMSSTLELTSAPLVVPFTIDKIYTMQVFA
ncbi:MAG: major capsid protein [bacterium]|jgi:hypothetical protein